MSSKVNRTLHPMSVWDEEAVMNAFKDNDVNPKHYVKVMAKLYEDMLDGKIVRLEDFVLPTDAPHRIYKFFKSGDFALMTTKVVRREDSRDGTTSKLLVELQDGKQVEAVLMRYNNSVTGGHKRTTLCVSSQVGCAMACSFCATGTMGLLGNLYGGEILEQFIWANQVEHIRNVVFMGMGEPLNNYDAVLSTIKAMVHGGRFALKQNRVTLSTVGIVPKMMAIMEQAPYVTLALSLHAPTQAMREIIVPAAHQYHITNLVDAIDYYYETTGKQMLIEYVLLDDVNASEETAHLLGKLLHKRQVLLNIIPFNPVLTKARHVAPSAHTVARFAEIVSQEYGVLTTARKEFGQDISGACGQLAVKTFKKNAALPSETLKETRVEENDDDEDLMENGLEGLFSTRGEMASKDIVVKCSDDDAGDNTQESKQIEDMENLVDAPKAKKSTATTSTNSECAPDCACHSREEMIRKAVEGIDENDVFAYSMAVLSTGPRLEHVKRRPKAGVTRKQLIEEGKLEAEDIEEQIQRKMVSGLVMPPNSKDVKARVFMPKKNIQVEGLETPLVVTHEDDFGKSNVMEEKLQHLQQQKAARADKSTVTANATVDDASDSDAEVSAALPKSSDAEELILDTNIEHIVSSHRHLVKQAIKEEAKNVQKRSMCQSIIDLVLGPCRQSKKQKEQ